MVDPVPLMALALAVFVLPGLLSWWLARRYGIGVLWAALIVGAILCVVGWIDTQEPRYMADAIARQIMIYMILLPGFVGLVLGAAIGVMGHRRDQRSGPGGP